MNDRLTRDEWTRRRAAHRAAVGPWADERIRRAARGEKHPVYDFLFEYYSFRPGHLLRWSPGVGVTLLGAVAADLDWKTDFVPADDGFALPAAAFPSHRLGYLRWAVRFLEAVAEREPQFGCFGLHEWAMLYRTDAPRHGQVPFRLTSAEIAAVVEGQGLRCTHYDAFRFFTPAAVPRNRVPLTRADATANDQPGCVHANMDLYKLVYSVAPFLPSELMADTFDLARRARELDMRATPYDLRAFGFAPIPVETRAGREEYVAEQRRLAADAAPLRRRVLSAYVDLEAFVSAAHVVTAG